uniref:Bicaudal C homolog 2 n=1 Tax=Neogobius melanostomus TaxID=47308 RepID=A0A8C6U4Y9_9GOBI
MATTTVTSASSEDCAVSASTVGPAPPEVSPGPETETDPEPIEAQSGDPKERDDEEEVDADGTPAAEQERDPDWVEERFRIDRKKLEHMLYCKTDGAETGEEFFERVMRETETQVKWPSKLKIGAKSKKDPHVKVEGKRDSVLQAKKMILEVLETRVNGCGVHRALHVIGKGGGNIKKVMEVASCHIHFPDSNRHNASGEKSNQVTLSNSVGPAATAAARRQFPLVQQVVQSLGVSVSFRAAQPQTQPAFYGSCCTVWGCTGRSKCQATCILMELLLGSEAAAGMVSTQLDNGAHFLSVMHQTQTQIILPDLGAPQSPPSLLIQGSPEGVCLARQQLMDCLPVCLMFDMREDGEADPCKLAQMMQTWESSLVSSPKSNKPSVVVKGLEKNISCLYEARRLLLGLDSCDSAKVTDVIPDPVTSGSGLTHYWLHMLLQQLRISEQGEPPTALSKYSPLTPPGLSPHSDDGRSALKGTESWPLEKVTSFLLFFNSSCVHTFSTSVTESVAMSCVCPAMQRKPLVSEVRTPTDTWSGLGFSKSMPAEAIKELRNVSRRSYKPYLSTNQQSWAAQMNKASNGSDCENWRDRCGSSSSSPSSPPSTLPSASAFPAQRSPSPQICDDLPELLSQLGLLKYIDVFEEQEIDYQTFLTLSDDDLKEVGVSTFGARRKMLLAISDLNRSKRRLSDASSVKSGYLEGGASGRLPRIMDVDAATQSNRW